MYFRRNVFEDTPFQWGSMPSRSGQGHEGFTLVEVIVVAVIVAVLSASAIPLYLNYVTNARIQVAKDTAGGIATFCSACATGGGSVGGISANPQSNITVTCSGGMGDQTSMKVPPDYLASVSSLTSPSTVTVTSTATAGTQGGSPGGASPAGAPLKASATGATTSSSGSQTAVW
jgi:prepilin-type N-terminal cleavage/methylation domain-containing protein